MKTIGKIFLSKLLTLTRQSSRKRRCEKRGLQIAGIAVGLTQVD